MQFEISDLGGKKSKVFQLFMPPISLPAKIA